jgi:hypothetical protein
LPEIARLQRPIGRLNATNQLRLSIGLSLRNPQGLTNLLQQLYQRGSPRFHRYLTPGEFTAQFAPAAAAYRAVIDFANAHGLRVTGIHANRTLVDVTGSVADIERALRVHMNIYRHPTESRTFYAADADPSLDLVTPVLAIAGLNNYTIPQTRLKTEGGSQHNTPLPNTGTGSGPNNDFWGGDFRAAYVPGVSLDGTGQAVGLVEFDNYRLSDISNYENAVNIAPVPVQTVLIDGFDGTPSGTLSEQEVDLDIELPISMAPGLSRVLVYECSPYATLAQINDMLNQMANDDVAKQLSCSWNFDINASTEQIFQQYAAQGQSFFIASGDSGAYTGPVPEPADDPNLTCVGGTYLFTTGTGGAWASETAWDANTSTSSSGGISAVYPIPFWQQGMDMSANQGSATMRNLPDVAMVAASVWIFERGGQGNCSGTSLAAPLWAGFTALVNQQAALNGQPPVGFLNPALYDIGKSANYEACFHDITNGNNFTAESPGKFSAFPAYDLCTGWGTPAGSNLIATLLAPADALVLSPQLGFTAGGPAGGPFNIASEKYTLTNAGTAPLNWSIVNTSLWLTVSPASGTLAPGGSAAFVTVSLNADATNSPIQDVSGAVVFTDLSDGVARELPFALLSGNGGFETGDFTDWVFSGGSNAAAAVGVDVSRYSDDILPGIDDSLFVHSGLYGAYLGQRGSVATLSQTLPTVIGQPYHLSFWLQSFAQNGTNTPNEFLVQWNGHTLFDQTNLPVFGWTNFQFIVTGAQNATSLMFGFRNDSAAFALDDILLQPVPAPTFQSVTGNANSFTLTVNAVPEVTYQVQFTTDLILANWSALGPPMTATNNVLTFTDALPANPQRFYRIATAP